MRLPFPFPSVLYICLTTGNLLTKLASYRVVEITCVEGVKLKISGERLKCGALKLRRLLPAADCRCTNERGPAACPTASAAGGRRPPDGGGGNASSGGEALHRARCAAWRALRRLLPAAAAAWARKMGEWAGVGGARIKRGTRAKAGGQLAAGVLPAIQGKAPPHRHALPLSTLAHPPARHVDRIAQASRPLGLLARRLGRGGAAAAAPLLQPA